MIVVSCAIGAYAIQNAMFDIWLMLGFGVVGYVFKKIGIPLAPFTLALVLGNRAEDAFRLSMIGSGGDMKVFGPMAWSVRLRRWRSCCCSGLSSIRPLAVSPACCGRRRRNGADRRSTVIASEAIRTSAGSSRLLLNQLRALKYKLVSWGPRETRLRSIKPSAAICCKLCLMLAADHIPNCLQSNKPETAFSSPTGTSFKSSLDMDIHAKCLLPIMIDRPNQPNTRTECRQKF